LHFHPPQPITTGFNYHAEEINKGRSGGRGQVADAEKVMGERGWRRGQPEPEAKSEVGDVRGQRSKGALFYFAHVLCGGYNWNHKASSAPPPPAQQHDAGA